MKAAEAEIGVLIVDDEEPARTLLSEMLTRQPGVRILRECANGFEALRAAGELSPDVVLLDIEMPKLNGFEVAELLDPKIAVVFVTAYDSYALRAFEIHAVDYILKPYRAERLREAVQRTRERLASRRKPVDPVALSASARPEGQYLERVVVKDGPHVHVLPAGRLDYLEAQDDYVSLKSGGKRFLKSQTLSSLAKSLDPVRFVRVHRSFVINLERLERIELYSKNSRVAILADGTRIPISREGHTRLKALIEGSS